MDNLKDFKNEALVVTNASDGNTPHIVQGIEPDGSLRTKPLAQAKPSETFLHIDRNESVIGTCFSTLRNRPPVGEWTRWIGSSSHAWA